jgi:hypothetical protein
MHTTSIFLQVIASLIIGAAYQGVLAAPYQIERDVAGKVPRSFSSFIILIIPVAELSPRGGCGSFGGWCITSPDDQ